MSELISASKPAFYLAKKSSLWVLSKTSKWLQKKFFPLDLDLFSIHLEKVPKIFSESENSYVSFDLIISNYSPYYSYQILSIIADCWIWDKKFIRLSNSQFLELESGTKEQQYSLNTYIGLSGEKRAKEQFNGNEIGESKLDINVTLITPFGVQNHRIKKDIQIQFIES